MNHPDRILLIEDDAELVDILSSRLTREGFEVRSCSDGVQGLQSAKSELPSLVLLDLMLPGMKGMDVCRQLKEGNSTRNIPVVMLTANSSDAEVIAGLEMGADDYVTKPFNFQQLVARIRAVLRRYRSSAASSPPTRIALGPLEVDAAGRDVKVHGKSVSLTESEFQLLYRLTSRAGQACDRSELLELLADGTTLVDRNVDVHVANLRKKLGPIGKFVITVRGVGYKFATHDQMSQEAGAAVNTVEN